MILAEDDTLAEGWRLRHHQHLAQRARELIDAPDECERLARRGFEIMSARPAVEYRAALDGEDELPCKLAAGYSDDRLIAAMHLGHLLGVASG